MFQLNILGLVYRTTIVLYVSHGTISSMPCVRATGRRAHQGNAHLYLWPATR
jgi:hypothetical protein